MSNPESNPESHLSRCQRWLDTEESITAEAIQNAIQGTSRKLQGIPETETAMREDLKETLQLMNDYLAEMAPEGQARPARPVAAEAQSAPAQAGPLDLSPLGDDATFTPPADDAERRQRLEELMASGLVKRGVK